jgi:hypothetical protein
MSDSAAFWPAAFARSAVALTASCTALLGTVPAFQPAKTSRVDCDVNYFAEGTREEDRSWRSSSLLQVMLGDKAQMRPNPGSPLPFLLDRLGKVLNARVVVKNKDEMTVIDADPLTRRVVAEQNALFGNGLHGIWEFMHTAITEYDVQHALLISSRPRAA